MPLLSKRARRDQALAELDRLRQELQRWYDDRTEADRHVDGSPRGQYQTQLQSISSEVSGAVKILADDLGNLDLKRDVADIYEHCALIERQTYWLWRVWYFFREKFDQRNDPRFDKILRAADEVVWSCYRPFFELPALKNWRPPAPLPYIEPTFSPSALRRDQRQALDRKDQDFLLVKGAFAELPVPLIKIPIASIHNPWALVLIGHEIGHIVQPLLEADFNQTFADAIQTAVENAGVDEEDQAAWSAWADEIFADLYCILTMGQWGVWALAQFETGRPEVMSERRTVYPAAYTRLKLMHAMADRLKLPTEKLVAPPAPSKELQKDLTLSGAVADAIIALPKIHELAAALPFDASAYAGGQPGKNMPEVEQWPRHIRGLEASPASSKIRSARMAVAGGASAWSQAVYADDDEQPIAVGEALASKVVAKVAGGAAP